MSKFKDYIIKKEDIETLEELGRVCRGDILKMTTLAGCGHPGGSMSSIDIYLTLYTFANISLSNFDDLNRDRIVISHGHTSPGVYSALGRLGFFPIDEAIAYFRLKDSIFEGHVERDVPGVEWTTGNLGQGLSASCGFALGMRLLNINGNVFTVMGDGEQQKGQISEARRFAKKYNLNNLTAIVDYNKLQISGSISKVMLQDIRANYESDGWEVIEINGHNFEEIFNAVKESVSSDKLVVIIAHTVMGKGVSFMENDEKYHGQALSEELLDKALKELNIENDLEKYKKMRSNPEIKHYREIKIPDIPINTNGRIVYSADQKLDNRSAYGNALKDIGEKNSNDIKFAVFDCDLSGSVKTSLFKKIRENEFFEAGIQEHNTATLSGAISTMPIVSVFSDFGMFGVDEVYNQLRLNDINFTNLKLICTHVGVNVGEDGKTHHCIDYVGLLSNLYNFKIIIPADPNQTDVVVRYALKEKGNFFIGMGRSKLPVITDEQGNIFFNENYNFVYGKADKLRDGDFASIICMGSVVEEVLEAYNILKEKGINVKIFNVSAPTLIDIDMLREAIETNLIVTVEDHNFNTGLGSKVANALIDNGMSVKMIKLGVTNYTTSDKPKVLYKVNGIDAESIAEKIVRSVEC
jgi:transketolase